jgi:hypothetical protein
VAGAVRERTRGRKHAVAVWAQGGQAPSHLSRQPFDAADLHPDRRPGIDRDRRRAIVCDRGPGGS